jgi:hypothetical protein
LNFNTVHPALDFVCPCCGEKLTSGVGFRVGAVLRHNYKMRDELIWQGGECRPQSQPALGNIKTVGYFNCDNPACSSWTDCFPEVQYALVTVQGNRITTVESFPLPDDAEIEEFAIIEMA